MLTALLVSGLHLIFWYKLAPYLADNSRYRRISNKKGKV